MSQLPTTRCEITGLSLLDLRKIGDKLSVDRIDSSQGYVPGNVQIIALSLNNAKQDRDDVPQRAIARLLKRLQRIVESRLSHDPKAHP